MSTNNGLKNMRGLATDVKQWTGENHPGTADARPAKQCECPEPMTYTEEDGERRCMCGRAARK